MENHSFVTTGVGVVHKMINQLKEFGLAFLFFMMIMAVITAIISVLLRVWGYI